MPLTKFSTDVTADDKIGCVATRGHDNGTVTLYYEGDVVPAVEWSSEALPTEDQF